MQKIVQRRKFFLSRMLCNVAPRFWMELRYFQIFKKRFHRKSPQTYAERLITAMQSSEYEKLTPYADKWKVREYVTEVVGEQYLPPLLAVYAAPEEIVYDQIPEGAFIKLNHGSGFNIPYHRHQLGEIQKQVKDWFYEDFTKAYQEAQYRNIEKKILVEENILSQGETLWEYSFFVFRGRVEFVQIYNNQKQRFEVGRDYETLPFRLYSTVTEIQPKSVWFETMRTMAEQLAAIFTFVRVDFMLAGDKIYFSELTFSPGAGLRRFYPEEYNYIFGKKLTFDIHGVIHESV